MPETEVTREQLLASVYQLQPGDLLVLRVPKTTRVDQLYELEEYIRRHVGEVRVLVVREDIEVEAYHQQPAGSIAEAVRLSRQHPGQVIQVEEGGA